jgi:hypothetical protein
LNSPEPVSMISIQPEPDSSSEPQTYDLVNTLKGRTYFII